MTEPCVEILYQESWRADIWLDEEPSRPGWQVRCSEHGLLGSPPGWAYAERGSASMVATRHRRKHGSLAAVPDKRRLIAALRDALDGMEDMIGYVPEYFQEKWGHQEYIDRARATLAEMSDPPDRDRA